LVDEQREVGRILRAPAPAQFFLVKGADPEAVLAAEEALRTRLDDLVARGSIAGYHAVSEWVPSNGQQARDAALVDQRLLASGGPLDRVATRLGEGSAWARAARARNAPPSAPLSVDEWLASPLSEPLRNQWLGRVDGGWASVITLEGVTAANAAQLAAVAGLVPGAAWVDRVATVSTLLGRYRRQMTWVVVASFALLWLVMFPRYGARTWRVLAPTGVGGVLTVSAFGLFGQPLQLMHILALLLILAMGVDYGIFVAERTPARRGRGWLTVVVSCVSALLSFGLLALSGTPALHFFGLTMLVGLTLVALITPCFLEAA